MLSVVYILYDGICRCHHVVCSRKELGLTGSLNCNTVSSLCIAHMVHSCRNVSCYFVLIAKFDKSHYMVSVWVLLPLRPLSRAHVVIIISRVEVLHTFVIVRSSSWCCQD